MAREVCGADAEGELNWSQFGMKWSKYGEGDAGKVHLPNPGRGTADELRLFAASGLAPYRIEQLVQFLDAQRGAGGQKG